MTTIKTQCLGPVTLTKRGISVPGWRKKKISTDGGCRQVWRVLPQVAGWHWEESGYVFKLGPSCKEEARNWEEAKDTASAKWLVPVLEHGTQDGEHWLIMPFVDLETKAVSVLQPHAAGVSMIAYEMDVRDICFSPYGGSVNWGVDKVTGKAVIYDYAQ